ncbi:MAG: GIY-YIG nuclease family protein [Dehalococcoidia bacterium]|nr:GIY-YIG nuclease family protein [Dehalococcoidia bacterium]
MPESTSYHVCVLQNDADQLYIGFTADLEERVRRHQIGDGGWTRGRGPWRLVHHEQYQTETEARRRERQLKSGKPNQRLRTQLGLR